MEEETFIQLLERRFVTADGVIVWNEQTKGLIESAIKNANFSKQKVVSLFKEFSQYRNSDEMHNGEPMEFEQWFDQQNSTVLTSQQIIKAKEWYDLHKYHVLLMKSKVDKYFAPTDGEDKNNPNLWKPEHWLWFLKTHL